MKLYSSDHIVGTDWHGPVSAERDACRQAATVAVGVVGCGALCSVALESGRAWLDSWELGERAAACRIIENGDMLRYQPIGSDYRYAEVGR